MTPLAIEPLAKVLSIAPGTMPTVQYTATADGGAVAPEWTFDRGELGTLDVSSGLFTTLGTLGGVGHVTATLGSATASTTLEIDLVQSENGDPAYPTTGRPARAARVASAAQVPRDRRAAVQIGVLQTAPTTDSAVHILYPYDGTVWPQGLLPPLIAWDPGVAHVQRRADPDPVESLHVHGHVRRKRVAVSQHADPTAAWNTLTYSNDGANDPVTVTVTFSDATTNTAVGPYTLTWHIAPGT